MKKRVLVGIFTVLFATFLMSHNAFAINGWNVVQTMDMNTSSLAGASNPINQSWFTPVRYYPNANQGSYSRLYNPVLYVSGNAMTVSKGQKFRIYLYGNVYTEGLLPNGVDTIETDALVRYTGNFVCTDDDFILSPNNYGVYQESVGRTLDTYQLQYTFVHKLDCYATADNLQLHNLKLGGNLVKYNTTYLGGDEFFDFDFSGKIVAYDDLEYEVLKQIESSLDSIGSKIDTTNSRLNTTNTHLNTIKENTEDIADDVNAIRGSANTSAQKDAQDMQAYNNMQNTDGLINIGDQSGALSIVGSINSLLGQVESIPTGASCSILGNLGSINLGDLNFCQGKENFGAIVTFVATGIFLFISFFIVIRIIRRILRLIAWARSN